MNRWYQEVMDALQPMEEMGGPELEEYILTMEAIKEDVSKRLSVATQKQMDIDIKTNKDNLPQEQDYIDTPANPWSSKNY